MCFDFARSGQRGIVMHEYNFLEQQPLDVEKHDFFLAAQQLKQRVDREPPSLHNVRRHQRSSTSIPVSIQPLDEDFNAVGEQFWVVSRDISPMGMGLICPEPFGFEFVRTGLLNKNATVISRVRHNTSIGETHPMFLVAIEFINGTELWELTG